MPVTKNPDYRDMEKYEVKLNDKDVSPYIIDMKLYQDMFIPYFTGIIQFFDPYSFVDEVKIGDSVKIKMKTKQGFSETDGEIKCTMKVFNITGRYGAKDHAQYFTLHIASEQFQKDIETKVVQTFKNKKIDAIINECLGKIGSSIEGYIKQPPTNTISYIAPNVSPLVACNMVLRATTPQPDYVLYPFSLDESGNNTYMLSSLTDLLKEEPVITFNQGIYNTEESRYQNQNLQVRHPNINQMDDMTNRLVGFNSNTLNTIDVNEREWKSKPEQFKGSNAPTTNIGFQPIVKEAFDEGETIPEKSREWMQQRKHRFFQLLQFPVTFSTFGFCKAWELYSKTAYLDFLNNDIRKESPEKYKMIKGKPFLITAVTHHVNARNEYRNSFRMISWEIGNNT